MSSEMEDEEDWVPPNIWRSKFSWKERLPVNEAPKKRQNVSNPDEAPKQKTRRLDPLHAANGEKNKPVLGSVDKSSSDGSFREFPLPELPNPEPKNNSVAAIKQVFLPTLKPKTPLKLLRSDVVRRSLHFNRQKYFTDKSKNMHFSEKQIKFHRSKTIINKTISGQSRVQHTKEINKDHVNMLPKRKSEEYPSSQPKKRPKPCLRVTILEDQLYCVSKASDQERLVKIKDTHTKDSASKVDLEKDKNSNSQPNYHPCNVQPESKELIKQLDSSQRSFSLPIKKRVLKYYSISEFSNKRTHDSIKEPIEIKSLKPSKINGATSSATINDTELNSSTKRFHALKNPYVLVHKLNLENKEQTISKNKMDHLSLPKHTVHQRIPPKSKENKLKDNGKQTSGTTEIKDVSMKKNTDKKSNNKNTAISQSCDANVSDLPKISRRRKSGTHSKRLSETIKNLGNSLVESKRSKDVNHIQKMKSASTIKKKSNVEQVSSNDCLSRKETQPTKESSCLIPVTHARKKGISKNLNHNPIINKNTLNSKESGKINEQFNDGVSTSSPHFDKVSLLEIKQKITSCDLHVTSKDTSVESKVQTSNLLCKDTDKQKYRPKGTLKPDSGNSKDLDSHIKNYKEVKSDTKERYNINPPQLKVSLPIKNNIKKKLLNFKENLKYPKKCLFGDSMLADVPLQDNKTQEDTCPYNNDGVGNEEDNTKEEYYCIRPKENIDGKIKLKLKLLKRTPSVSEEALCMDLNKTSVRMANPNDIVQSKPNKSNETDAKDTTTEVNHVGHGLEAPHCVPYVYTSQQTTSLNDMSKVGDENDNYVTPKMAEMSKNSEQSCRTSNETKEDGSISVREVEINSSPSLESLNGFLNTGGSLDVTTATQSGINPDDFFTRVENFHDIGNCVVDITPQFGVKDNECYSEERSEVSVIPNLLGDSCHDLSDSIDEGTCMDISRVSNNSNRVKSTTSETKQILDISESLLHPEENNTQLQVLEKTSECKPTESSPRTESNMCNDDAVVPVYENDTNVSSLSEVCQVSATSMRSQMNEDGDTNQVDSDCIRILDDPSSMIEGNTSKQIKSANVCDKINLEDNLRNSADTYLPKLNGMFNTLNDLETLRTFNERNVTDGSLSKRDLSRKKSPVMRVVNEKDDVEIIPLECLGDKTLCKEGSPSFTRNSSTMKKDSPEINSGRFVSEQYLDNKDKLKTDFAKGYSIVFDDDTDAICSKMGDLLFNIIYEEEPKIIENNKSSVVPGGDDIEILYDNYLIQKKKIFNNLFSKIREKIDSVGINEKLRKRLLIEWLVRVNRRVSSLSKTTFTLNQTKISVISLLSRDNFNIPLVAGCLFRNDLEFTQDCFLAGDFIRECSNSSTKVKKEKDLVKEEFTSSKSPQTDSKITLNDPDNTTRVEDVSDCLNNNTCPVIHLHGFFISVSPTEYALFSQKKLETIKGTESQNSFFSLPFNFQTGQLTLKTSPEMVEKGQTLERNDNISLSQHISCMSHKIPKSTKLYPDIIAPNENQVPNTNSEELNNMDIATNQQPNNNKFYSDNTATIDNITCNTIIGGQIKVQIPKNQSINQIPKSTKRYPDIMETNENLISNTNSREQVKIENPKNQLPQNTQCCSNITATNENLTSNNESGAQNKMKIPNHDLICKTSSGEQNKQIREQIPQNQLPNSTKFYPDKTETDENLIYNTNNEQNKTEILKNKCDFKTDNSPKTNIKENEECLEQQTGMLSRVVQTLYNAHNRSTVDKFNHLIELLKSENNNEMRKELLNKLASQALGNGNLRANQSPISNIDYAVMKRYTEQDLVLEYVGNDKESDGQICQSLTEASNTNITIKKEKEENTDQVSLLRNNTLNDMMETNPDKTYFNQNNTNNSEENCNAVEVLKSSISAEKTNSDPAPLPHNNTLCEVKNNNSEEIFLLQTGTKVASITYNADCISTPRTTTVNTCQNDGSGQTAMLANHTNNEAKKDYAIKISYSQDDSEVEIRRDSDKSVPLPHSLIKLNTAPQGLLYVGDVNIDSDKVHVFKTTHFGVDNLDASESIEKTNKATLTNKENIYNRTKNKNSFVVAQEESNSSNPNLIPDNSPKTNRNENEGCLEQQNGMLSPVVQALYNAHNRFKADGFDNLIELLKSENNNEMRRELLNKLAFQALRNGNLRENQSPFSNIYCEVMKGYTEQDLVLEYVGNNKESDGQICQSFTEASNTNIRIKKEKQENADQVSLLRNNTLNDMMETNPDKTYFNQNNTNNSEENCNAVEVLKSSISAEKTTPDPAPLPHNNTMCEVKNNNSEEIFLLQTGTKVASITYNADCISTPRTTTVNTCQNDGSGQTAMLANHTNNEAKKDYAIKISYSQDDSEVEFRRDSDKSVPLPHSLISLNTAPQGLLYVGDVIETTQVDRVDNLDVTESIDNSNNVTLTNKENVCMSTKNKNSFVEAQEESSSLKSQKSVEEQASYSLNQSIENDPEILEGNDKETSDMATNPIWRANTSTTFYKVLPFHVSETDNQDVNNGNVSMAVSAEDTISLKLPNEVAKNTNPAVANISRMAQALIAQTKDECNSIISERFVELSKKSGQINLCVCDEDDEDHCKFPYNWTTESPQKRVTTEVDVNSGVTENQKNIIEGKSTSNPSSDHIDETKESLNKNPNGTAQNLPIEVAKSTSKIVHVEPYNRHFQKSEISNTIESGVNTKKYKNFRKELMMSYINCTSNSQR